MKRALWIDWGIVGICLFFSLITMWLNWQSPVARALLNEERITGIVFGSDYEDNTRHSDTIMVVSYDPRSRFLDQLSIPRDTQVSVPGVPSIRRINEVFAFEFKRSDKNFDIASLATKNTVQTLLSSGTVNGFQIPFYLAIDYAGFRNLVDALGGLYIRVTEPMRYVDHWGHLDIDFKPGTYLMNGHSALLYVRYRGANADQGRVTRQQLFVKQLLKRLGNPMAMLHFPHRARVLLDGLHTNFTLWDMVSILIEARQVDWSNLRLFSLPGSPNGVLWKMNEEKTRLIVTMMQTPAPTGQAVDNRVITVEVYNASNRPNAARVVVQLLRDKGFDVVKYGTFALHQQRTYVIDRTGQLRPAQAVAQALQESNPEVISRVDPSRHVDVTVTLGNDAAELQAKKWGWH